MDVREYVLNKYADVFRRLADVPEEGAIDRARAYKAERESEEVKRDP